jgi:serine/threonine protein kinase
MIDPAYKPRHVKPLIRLSRASRLYPECLVLKGLEIEGDPVAWGSFADVHKGRLRGNEVAIKVLKVYERSDMDKLLKVIPISGFSLTRADEAVQGFSSEAVTWRQLSHRNVLPFYGIYHLDVKMPRVCLVCPWMTNGNLVEFLASCASDTDCIPLVSCMMKFWASMNNNCFFTVI